MTAAPSGMVATSTHDAAEAGASILRRGGNAVDAAIATAAASAVVEPCSNGLGGDVAALVWFDGELYGLNGTGALPASATAVETFGPASITVPGGIGAWAALHERFGRLPIAEVFDPAIALANNGFDVTPSTAAGWKRAWSGYRAVSNEPWFAEWTTEFGDIPAAGDVRRSESQGQTLRRLAEHGLNDFYRGDLARKIVAAVNGLDASDLADYAPQWVAPLSVPYHGHHIWGLPPNIQGTVALQALGMLDTLDTPTPHHAIEAVKLAFADTDRYLGDPATMTIDVSELVDPDYLRTRASHIGDTAQVRGPGRPPSGGTIYLATADHHGNSVSLLQSNFRYFGSGVVVPGTGIALHNRASAFDSRSGRPNSPVPGRRPRHTIVPGFVSRNSRPVGPLGVMGAAMQPQGQVQLLMSMIDQGKSPQHALDEPRWKWTSGNDIDVEHDFPDDLERTLRSRGHHVTRVDTDTTGAAPFGRGQVIRFMKNGMLQGGTDPRVDGAIAPC